jgi:outer membrane protein TolC
MIKIYYYSLLGLILFPAFLQAQDTVLITKKTLLEKASAQNLQIKIAEKEFKSAQADYRQSNAVMLPSISLSHTAMVTTNPLMAFGSKLNQEILTMADFNPALLNDPATTRNYATRIEVLQPLLNVDGFYGRAAAKAKMEAYDLKAERTKEYLELELSKAYMQLQLAYKALQVMEKANATGDANLKLVENYFKQGMLQKTDLLMVQVRVGEIKNQLQYTKSNVQNASDYLAFLLNEDPKGKTFKPAEEMEKSLVVEQLSSWLPDNRRDLLAMDKSVAAYKQVWHMGQWSMLPRLNAFSSYELYDQRLFGTQAKGYLVGLQLSWNLFDGYKSLGKTQKAKAEYQKMSFEAEQYKAQSKLELDKSQRQLKDAEQKVNLASLAYQQSQEAYRIRNNRFNQGLEKTSDLLAAETQQLQKELEYLQSLFDYHFTKQYVQFLSK